jgi:hypothetical protein
LQAHVTITHLALDLSARHECGDRVNNDEVDGAGAHQCVGDLQCLLTRIGLGHVEVVEIDAELVNGEDKTWGSPLDEAPGGFGVITDSTAAIEGDGVDKLLVALFQAPAGTARSTDSGTGWQYPTTLVCQLATVTGTRADNSSMSLTVTHEGVTFSIADTSYTSTWGTSEQVLMDGRPHMIAVKFNGTGGGIFGDSSISMWVDGRIVGGLADVAEGPAPAFTNLTQTSGAGTVTEGARRILGLSPEAILVEVPLDS